MQGLVVALGVLSIALILQVIFLRSHFKRLRAQEHAFRFHQLRDNFQELVMFGRLDQRSTTHQVIIWVINFAIKNSGELRLRDLVWIAKGVDERMKSLGGEFWKDLTNQPGEVQELVGQTFFALANMMQRNDSLVTVGVVAHEFLRNHGFQNRVLGAMDELASRLLPQHAEVVYGARQLEEMAAKARPLAVRGWGLDPGGVA